MSQTAEVFRRGLLEDLAARLPDDDNLAEFVTALEHLDCSAVQDRPSGPLPETVTDHLATVLDGLPADHAFSDAVRTAASSVNWYQIFQGGGIEPNLAKGLIAGQVVGKVGLAYSKSMYAGLFLLAPGICYPLHQHEATELYYVVSGTLTLQHGRTGTPFAVKGGEWSVTLPNRTHSLTTNDGPCLIAYAWVDKIESANWWWEQSLGGAWNRECWERQSDGQWSPTRTEPITDEILSEAGEI